MLTRYVRSGQGITFIFNVAMLYRNSNALEEGQYGQRSSDYAWHLIISAVSIIVSVLHTSLNVLAHFICAYWSGSESPSKIRRTFPTALCGNNDYCLSV